jgi:oligoendopeptidase F
MDLRALRERIDCFREELSREGYLHWSGQKDEIELIGIYKRYSDTWSNEALDCVRSELRDKGDEEKSRRYFEHFIVDRRLSDAVRELREEVTNAEARAKVTWDDKDVPFRKAAVLLQNEPDSARRRDLLKRTTQVLAEFNPLLEKILLEEHRLCRAWGYSSYEQAYTNLKGVDYRALAAELQRFLIDTEPIYHDIMESELQEKLGIPLNDAWQSDVSYLMRAPHFDHLFPAEKLIPCLEATLAGLGINLHDQKNVEVDVESRPKKSPRAFCSSIRVPHEVKLVISPVGGPQDYTMCLHEAGHAEHYAFTGEDLPIEYKRLGDVGLTELYAFLLNYLVTDEEWLKGVMKITETEPFLREALRNKLYMLRRYSAKLSYELILHNADDLSDLADTYAEELSSATLTHYLPERYLYDLDDAFYCADYLRAWIGETQLRDTLRTKYGTRWFQNEKAGGFLKELWNTGHYYRIEELLKELGHERLDLHPVLTDLSRLKK